MRSRISLLVVSSALVAAGAVLWSSAGGAVAPTTTPEATYIGHLSGKKGTQNWRGSEAITLQTGWYSVAVQSYTAASCWYVPGAKGVKVWPVSFSSYEGPSLYFVDVLDSSATIEVTCANGHAAGPIFATVISTTMHGNP
jgi:hypothetical protein